MTSTTEQVTVTLARAEVRAFGQVLLLKLSDTAERFAAHVPLRWSEWDPSKETTETMELLELLRRLERADAANESVELSGDVGWFRKLTHEGIVGALESLASVLNGGYAPDAALREFADSADTLAAHVSILERIGWGVEEVHGSSPETIRTFAERLS